MKGINLNSKYTFAYKTTSTPCSCPICKGERYNRRQENYLI